ncbi:uncharacterized protein LOC142978629 [Anticarsia gemmatalis]|uniref:uncharacterized protein LOC142978629 n=1 Tax=Anticarsia gemmatalis TaxID=129554 RepID=UPI003F774CE2
MFKLVVLLSVAAMAAAKPSLVAPVAYSAVVPGYSSVVPGYSSVSQYSSSVSHGAPAVYSAGVYGAPVYSGVAALSQAPHQPAVVLDAVNGVPLDTPEVVAARAAHYTAKALGPFHHLRKRSVVAPLAYSSVVAPAAVTYSSPVVSHYGAPVVSHYAAASPVVSAYSPYSALYPRALSVHPY